MADEWGPWIGWNGGECPVEPDVIVEVRLDRMPNDWCSNPDNASRFNWKHNNYPGDIIAYRVKRKPKVETVRRAMAVGANTGWILCGHAKDTGFINGYAIYEILDGVPDMSTLRWEDAD